MIRASTVAPRDYSCMRTILENDLGRDQVDRKGVASCGANFM